MTPAPGKAAAPAPRLAPAAAATIRMRQGAAGPGNAASMAVAQRAPSATSGRTAPGSGNAAMVQAQRTVPVAAHDDPAEREAERVARHVVETMQSTLVVTEAPRVIARQPSGATPFGAPSEAGLAAAATAGAPLPPGVRRFMESRFDADFSGISVHTDDRAARLADGMGARAFTHGKHMFFARGQYQPDTPGGAELIAHELAHTIQQGAAPKHTALAPSQASRVQRASVLGFDLSFSPRDWAAKQANLLPGFTLLTVILGRSPINGVQVDRSPANVIRAVITLLPLGVLIVQALDRYGIIDKVGGWVSAQIDTLKLTADTIGGAFAAALGAIELTDPSGSWERIKRIFTEPIDRIRQFVGGLVAGVIQFVKDAVLRPLADLASKTPAWDLLTALLGKNPITGDEVPQTAETIIGGLLKLAGEEEVWKNIQASGAIAKVAAWFTGAKAGLIAFVQQIPALFVATLRSFVIEDLLNLPGAIARVFRLFGDFASKFIGWVGNALLRLLEIVVTAVSPDAWAYIKKTGAALKKILKDPMPFVGNLVKAAKLGLQNFADNIGTHLKTALISWLTGALEGVYIPQALSLAEIGKFALSVLGLTWAQVRAAIVKALGPAGEKIMSGLEKAADFIIALVTGGPAALWEMIKEKLTDLKDTVIEGIKDFVISTIVKAAIPKLIAMFIPGAGFVAALVSIYGTIKSFIEQLGKIAAAVKAFIDSIVAIAEGQIGGAAKKVEGTLASVLPIVIGLLAGFLNLGNVSAKVMAIIKKVQAPVLKARDAAIAWLIDKAKKAFAWLFGKGDKDAKPDERTEEQKRQAKLAAIAEAEKLLHPEDFEEHEVQAKLGPIRKQHKLLTLNLVVDSRKDETETVHFVASASENEIGQQKQVKVAAAVQVTPVPVDSWIRVQSDYEQVTTSASVKKRTAAGLETPVAFRTAKIDGGGNTRSYKDETNKWIWENFTHGSKLVWAVGGAKFKLVPKKRGQEVIRAEFYGDSESIRDGIKSQRLPSLQSNAPSGYFLSQNPKLEKTFDSAKQNAPVPVGEASADHEPSIVKHWNGGGNNAIQSYRENWNKDPTTYQIISKWLNSKLGGKGGGKYTDDAGVSFRGPGE